MKEKLTAERARELLDYDPETGILRNRITRGSVAIAGEIAGYEALGYIVVCLDGIQYQAHRVIWLIVHGIWPTNFIDHRDGKKNHNTLENLREATKAQNSQNSPMRADNTSGFKGVGWHREKSKWRAYIHLGGRRGGKYKHLGYYDDINEAADAYSKASIKYYGEYARIC